MARTQNELADTILKELGALPDGQTPVASHRTQVKDEYDNLYQELLDDGIVNWSASDDIPNNVFTAIKNMLLNRCAAKFDVPNVWTVYGLEEMDMAMRKRIQRTISEPYTETTTVYEGF